MDIRAVEPKDFAAIAQFLHEEMDSSVSVERWLRLFQYNWLTPPMYGLGAFEQDKVLGFLGAVFGPQPKGSEKLVCNLSTWCVARSARGTGLGGALFDYYIKEERWHQTLLTAASYLVNTYLGFGYQTYETHRYVFSFKNFPSRLKVFENEKIPLEALCLEDKKIFLDHQNHRCRFLYLEEKSGNCFLVFKDLTRKSGIGFFSEVLYASDPQFCERHPEVLSLHALKDAESVVAMDKRYFQKAPREGKEEPLYSPRLFKCREIPPPFFHSLYSEVVLLDLKM